MESSVIHRRCACWMIPSMLLKAIATVHQLKMKQDNSVIIFE